AMIGRECRVESARRMLYGPDNRPERIEVLDAGLAPTGAFELVDPPVPRGTDPGGIPIALVDTGVNYTLDQIAPFLARSPDGALLGYDFWDLDERPFDADAQRSPFYPLRQGTSVASVLLRDAPAARLLVYRYPRPEMPRFTQLIDHAAAAGARIIHLSVATFHSEAWVEFRRGMRDYPDILFIAAAGDDRLDIDFTPVYPAAFRASNLLTVAAARVDGTLTDAANWGAQGVDISVPGQKVPGIGFDGQTQEFTGSPIAAARVSALAVCLLLEDPGLDQLDLKARITELAKWRPPDRPIRHGFIPDDVLAKLTGCRNGEGS
ncbi:MAG: S8 family serine peptidase, partial [Pseudomonadota bacterium]